MRLSGAAPSTQLSLEKLANVTDELQSIEDSIRNPG